MTLTFTFLTNPYLLAGLLTLVLAFFTYTYGLLGFVVITGHPLFLVLTLWTLFLILINRLRPILDRFLKNISRAFLRWIQRSMTPGKKLGESDSGDNQAFVKEVKQSIKECYGDACLALSEEEAG